MIVIGGNFPDDQNCDAPKVLGTHNIDLGTGNSTKKWSEFDPASPRYLLPPELVTRIGGS
jgi:hypothetical protein